MKPFPRTPANENEQHALLLADKTVFAMTSNIRQMSFQLIKLLIGEADINENF
jgi:hypothetical protein